MHVADTWSEKLISDASGYRLVPLSIEKPNQVRCARLLRGLNPTVDLLCKLRRFCKGTAKPELSPSLPPPLKKNCQKGLAFFWQLALLSDQAGGGGRAKDLMMLKWHPINSNVFERFVGLFDIYAVVRLKF